MAKSRRMRLNGIESEEDLLSDFSWQANNNYLFGMMLRIIPASNGGIIDSQLFEQPTISIKDVSEGDANKSQYKDHYYFAINNTHIVTNLSGTYSIDRLQTYLNWLLNSVRGTKLFEFTPVTKLPDGVKLSELKGIEFGGVSSSQRLTAGLAQTENRAILKMQELTDSIFEKLFSDTASLSEIERDQIITAKLVLTVKHKPKDMANDEYQRVMGTVMRQITNDSGIILIAKDGNKYRGEEIKVVRDVTVEKTSGNRIVEEQLKQRMESFLSDLNEQQP
ncbi:MAG: hypothetical protein HDS64_01725 [Bacteroidales bacterium]|nr:hypothetical protein [Bacteroidales bacterium]